LSASAKRYCAARLLEVGLAHDRHPTPPDAELAPVVAGIRTSSASAGR